MVCPFYLAAPPPSSPFHCSLWMKLGENKWSSDFCLCVYNTSRYSSNQLCRYKRHGRLRDLLHWKALFTYLRLYRVLDHIIDKFKYSMFIKYCVLRDKVCWIPFDINNTNVPGPKLGIRNCYTHWLFKFVTF